MKRTVPNRMLFAETRDQLLAGREVVVRVLGQSMLPFFRSGSRITLRPLREGDLRRGHVVLGETDNGHFVVHRILTVGDERVTLLGDGCTSGWPSGGCASARCAAIRWRSCAASAANKKRNRLSAPLLSYSSSANIGSHAGRRTGFCFRTSSTRCGTYFRSTTRRNIYSSNQRSVMIRCPL